MNKIKQLLILEDEKPNADRIKRLISELRPEITIVGVLTSISKTIDWLAKHECPDLIIMDIQLADGLSFEVFNQTEVKCPVIFATAYDEYAVKAFKYNSIDYLLKPIEKDELENAIIKFEHTLTQAYQQSTAIEELLRQMQPKAYRTRFFLPQRDAYRKINVADIAFFYSSLNITYAHLFGGEQIVVPHTMETLEKELEPKAFFRANRQYIVHANAIDKVHNFFNGKLKLKLKSHEEEVIVSRTKASLLKAWLDY